MRDINGIVVHWIGDGSSYNFRGKAAVERIRGWHLDEGWSDVGYHNFIDRDGNLMNGRPHQYSGAHCIPRNHDTLGLNLMYGTEDTKLTGDTVARTVRYIQEMASFYKFPIDREHVIGHQEGDPIAHTACPGPFIMKTLDAIVNAARNRGKPEQPLESQIRRRVIKLFGRPGVSSRAFIDGAEWQKLGISLTLKDGKIAIKLDGVDEELVWVDLKLGVKLRDGHSPPVP
jgi:hypothetical protein